MPGQCVLCGWRLDVYHVFNVHCAAANAEAEQVDAEAHEAMEQQPSEPDRLGRAMELVHDILAYERFKRDLRQ